MNKNYYKYDNLDFFNDTIDKMNREEILNTNHKCKNYAVLHECVEII